MPDQFHAMITMLPKYATRHVVGDIKGDRVDHVASVYGMRKSSLLWTNIIRHSKSCCDDRPPKNGLTRMRPRSRPRMAALSSPRLAGPWIFRGGDGY